MGLIIVVGKSYILAQVDFRWGIWQIKIPRLVWQASSRWYLTGTLGDQIVLYNYQIMHLCDRLLWIGVKAMSGSWYL